MVRELDQRLDSMGPVNLDAIQEYDELEQRHAFLEKQNQDLTNSKQELLDVIAKINNTTKTLFAETFEKIRVNFSEMFVELFGGGKANLLLTDDSDPLESGIDIIAKPPGKQLQTITVHHHLAPQAHHRPRRRTLRRDHGGARRLKAGRREIQHPRK